MFKKIKERKLEFEWKTTTRVDQINREILLEMKNSGCNDLFFGFETLHNYLLKIINKKNTYDQIKKAIKITREVGINVISSFILGLPFQTINHIFDQYKKMEQLGLIDKNLTMGWLVPFKGKEFYNNPNKYQLKSLTKDYYFYSLRFPIVETPHLSFSEAIKAFEFISIQIAKKIDPRWADLFEGQPVLEFFLKQLMNWIRWWKRNGWKLPDPDEKYLNNLENELNKIVVKKET